MSKHAVYDADGVIQYTIHCPDDQDVNQVAPPGMSLYTGPTLPTDKIDPVTVTVIPNAVPPMVIPLPPPPDPAYVKSRRMAYPKIEQQLEWMWQAMDAGTLPKIEPWYGQIAAVKAKFPKEVDLNDHGDTVDL
jgi:hypothetical protein